MTQSLLLRSGVFTDTGYRMRKNIVQSTDSWFWNEVREKTFFNFENYNYDAFEVSEDFPFIATMYFRLDTS